MKHYDKWISQRDLHEQYEAGYLAEAAYREALMWVKQSMINNADQETLTFTDIKKELNDEST